MDHEHLDQLDGDGNMDCGESVLDMKEAAKPNSSSESMNFTTWRETCKTDQKRFQLQFDVNNSNSGVKPKSNTKKKEKKDNLTSEDECAVPRDTSNQA